MVTYIPNFTWTFQRYCRYRVCICRLNPYQDEIEKPTGFWYWTKYRSSFLVFLNETGKGTTFRNPWTILEIVLHLRFTLICWKLCATPRHSNTIPSEPVACLTDVDVFSCISISEDMLLDSFSLRSTPTCHLFLGVRQLSGCTLIWINALRLWKLHLEWTI